MSKVKVLVLAAVAVFALTAFGASSALAVEWQLDGKAIASPGIKSTSKGTLELEDSGTGIRLECEGKDSGIVGPGASDKVEKIEATKCVTLAGECGSPTAKAIHLPWTTELYTSGGTIRDHLRSSGAGEPGWQVVCFGFIQDTCEGPTSTLMTNVTGGVDAEFEPLSEKANCSIGGNGAGSVEGVDLNESPAGKTLTVK